MNLIASRLILPFRREVQEIRKRSYIQAINLSFSQILNRTAIFLCILVYIVTGNRLTAAYAYTVSSFYNVIRQVVVMNFPRAVTDYAESSTSVKRVMTFLMHDEIECKDVGPTAVTNGQIGMNEMKEKDKEFAVLLENASVKWINSMEDNTLNNIDFQAKPKQLIAIVGPVGCGKTTLLHAILKELPPQTGSVYVDGTLSYASQEPWLFGGSALQNIIFGQEFDRNKFDEVVRVCSLERDFSLLQHGARTLVAERGVSLSGGQKARVNLARAIYKEADVYLLDDPLSAVDTHVGKQLFDKCICGYLKDKTVILVTHQLQYLRSADRIYLLEDGRVSASGTYDELKSVKSNFTQLLIETEQKKEMERQLSQYMEEESSKADTEMVMPQREKISTGTISKRVYKNFFLAGGSWCRNVILLVGIILSQVLISGVDYYLMLW